MELKDTITGMTSSDYKERFKAEYNQLKIRYKKLAEMLNKLDNGKLNFKPSCPDELLRDQMNIMANYLGLLQIRAEYEGIDLYDVS